MEAASRTRPDLYSSHVEPSRRSLLDRHSTNGASINTSAIPEDVQTWSYLALQDKRYACSIDWAIKHVITTDTATASNSTLTGTEFYGATFTDVSLASSPQMPPVMVLRSILEPSGLKEPATSLQPYPPARHVEIAQKHCSTLRIYARARAS